MFLQRHRSLKKACSASQAVATVAPPRRKSSSESGFSYLELVFVIGLISVLMAFAVERLLGLRVEAERVAVEQMLGTLRSALGIKVAESILKNDFAAIRALERSNPMTRLAQPPHNYVGEVDEATAQIVEGQWYFDTRTRYLVYRVYSTDSFVSALAGPKRARFAVQLAYDDKDKNGVFDARRDEVAGVQLVSVEPYRWLQ